MTYETGFLVLTSALVELHSEWAVNIQRDSYASYVGHYPMLAYFAIAENESIGRERYNFMQVFPFDWTFYGLSFKPKKKGQKVKLFVKFVMVVSRSLTLWH